MKKQTLILIPGRAYSGMEGMEVAKSYMKMASTDYDNLIKFNPEYEPLQDNEDYHEIVLGGPKKDFELFVFYRQHIVKAGDLESNVISTSNVMLLGSEKVEREVMWFPYIEAIEVEGDKNYVSDFASEVSKLYVEKNKWKMYFCDDKIKTKKVDCLTDRFNQINILDCKEIIKIAEEKMGFDSNKVSWK